jgi:hypothetical protein
MGWVKDHRVNTITVKQLKDLMASVWLLFGVGGEGGAEGVTHTQLPSTGSKDNKYKPHKDCTKTRAYTANS